jgi:hypothetical protein
MSGATRPFLQPEDRVSRFLFCITCIYYGLQSMVFHLFKFVSLALDRQKVITFLVH